MNMYPAISYDNKAVENNKKLFTNKHIMILKIIFTDVYINISKWIICKHIFFPSIANLKCTPSDKQMHPY